MRLWKLITVVSLEFVLNLNSTICYNFSTYVRGRTRIDYAFGTTHVLHALENACYEPFLYCTNGDHRAMVLDFNTYRLFGNFHTSLKKRADCEFTSTDATTTQQYIKCKYPYLQKQKIQERLSNLQLFWNAANTKALDRDFQRASHSASNNCRRTPNIAYRRKIASLQSKKHYLY